MRTKFSSYIDVHGQNIGINQRTAREWLRSKSAEKLLHTDSQTFLDKVNAFENADELLKASKEYVGEAAKHSRKDNFVEFARGIVAFKVGDNGYEADIIVGTTKSNVALLYDVVNIQHKEIVADTTDTVQDRRSGVSATTNNISQNAEKVNTSLQNSVLVCQKSVKFCINTMRISERQNVEKKILPGFIVMSFSTFQQYFFALTSAKAVLR